QLLAGQQCAAHDARVGLRTQALRTTHRHPPLLGDVLAIGVLQQPGRAVAAAHARVLHAATGVVDGRPCGRVAVVDGDRTCPDLRGDAVPRIGAGEDGGVETIDGVVGGIDRSHQVVNDLDED